MFKNSIFLAIIVMAVYSMQAMDMYQSTATQKEKKAQAHLYDTIKLNNTTQLKSLIEQKANVSHYNIIYPLTPTPLHYAISMGREECAKLLMSSSTCDIRCLNLTGGDAPLHFAIQKNNIMIAKAILEEANKRKLRIIDVANRQGDTPLHLIVTKINKNFNDLSKLPEEQQGENHDSSYDNWLKLADHLIASGANIGAKNKAGKSPLHLVLEPLHFSRELLTKFIDNGAAQCAGDIILTAIKDCDQLPSEWDEKEKTDYGLFMSDTIKKLIQGKADVNFAGAYGETALHKATREGYPEIVELLIENGASVNAVRNNEDKFEFNVTPLEDLFRKLEINDKKHKPCKIPDYYKKIIEILINQGANIGSYAGTKTPKEKTNPCYNNTIFPLHNPDILQDIELVELLLNNNTWVNLNAHETPLHVAIRCNCIEAAKLFLDWGADLTLENSNQQTPLELAYELRNSHLIDLVHAKINQTTPALRDVSKTYGPQCWRYAFMKRYGGALKSGSIMTCIAGFAAYSAYKGWLSGIKSCANFMMNYFTN